MKSVVSCLFVLVMMTVVAATVYSAPQAQQTAPAGSAETESYNILHVMHVFACQMGPGVTEAQVDAIAQLKLKALRQMPGAEKAQVRILWPTAVSNMGKTDFQIVWIFPSYTDWGKFWDAYNDASPVAKGDDLTEGKVECPDSALWEVHEIVPPK
jgi:hypothetical protein